MLFNWFNVECFHELLRLCINCLIICQMSFSCTLNRVRMNILSLDFDSLIYFYTISFLYAACFVYIYIDYSNENSLFMSFEFNEEQIFCSQLNIGFERFCIFKEKKTTLNYFGRYHKFIKKSRRFSFIIIVLVLMVFIVCTIKLKTLILLLHFRRNE